MEKWVRGYRIVALLVFVLSMAACVRQTNLPSSGYMTTPAALQADATADGGLWGRWRLTRDRTLDGRVEAQSVYTLELQMQQNQITARYVDLDNDSLFVGALYAARERAVLSLVQYDQGYYLVQSGQQVGADAYQGAWYDVAGESGDFRLERLEE
ncbi:MAG: hypothetical protein AB1894_26830 [Chloroflexota bacterium]